MFCKQAFTSGNKLFVPLQIVRGAKRKPAYPRYRAELAPLSHPKKDHAGFFQRHLKAWLGPKNIRGEYYRNKYYYPPQNNTPNYIVPNGDTLVLPGKESFSRSGMDSKRNPALHPFPQNLHCRTASIISDDLKQQIYSEVVEVGALTQEIAHKYGIKIARVEAIVKLQQIEKSWREEGTMNKEIVRFSSIMKKMFPLYDPPREADNLTEIPTPHKTLNQRFLTISESEPFGPVDAAKIFGLEPAQQTLDNLSEFKEESNHRVQLNKVTVGTQKDGDKVQFRFTNATSGKVGYRYGASRRDRKKDRAVGFDKLGRMVYTV